MKLFFTLTSSLFFLTNAIAQSARKVEADKIIAIVGEKVVLKSDINDEITDLRRRQEPVPEHADCSILHRQVRFKALLQQAENDSITVSDEEINRMVDARTSVFQRHDPSPTFTCGGDEISFQKLKEIFGKHIRNQYLVDRLSDRITAQVTITPREVKLYFVNKDPSSLPFYDSKIELGEIVLYPPSTPQQEQQTIDELHQLRRQVASGHKQIHALARQFSDDQFSKYRGGELWLNRNDRITTDPDTYQTFIDQAFRLESGQLSQVFKTKYGYHILQLESKHDNNAVVRHILLVPKVSDSVIHSTLRQLEAVRTQLINGTLSFQDAVNQYSTASTKSYGGFYRGNDGSTLILPDDLDTSLIRQLSFSTLQPGDYSHPIPFIDLSGRRGIRILFLKNRTAPHRQNLHDDYDHIAQEALAAKKQQAIEAWLASKIPSWYVMIDPDYRNCDLLRPLTSNTAPQQ